MITDTSSFPPGEELKLCTLRILHVLLLYRHISLGVSVTHDARVVHQTRTHILSTKLDATIAVQ